MLSRRNARMFFICGAPKSGTTWLQRMINSHPQAICKGEGHFIEQLVLPMASVLRGYNQKLQLVAERVYEGNPLYRKLDQNWFYDLCNQIIINQIVDGVSTDGVLVYGDKTPRYYEYLDNLKNLYPLAKIIHIDRDPRDIAVSSLYQAGRVGLPDALKKGTEARKKSIVASVDRYNKCCKSISDFRKRNNDDIFSTSYETLIVAPHSELKKICLFLEIDASPDLVDSCVSENSFQNTTNRAPGEMDPSAFVRKGIAGDWQNELEPHEVEYISKNVIV